jgi:hypothetical protein
VRRVAADSSPATMTAMTDASLYFQNVSRRVSSRQQLARYTASGHTRALRLKSKRSVRRRGMSSAIRASLYVFCSFRSHDRIMTTRARARAHNDDVQVECNWRRLLSSDPLCDKQFKASDWREIAS